MAHQDFSMADDNALPRGPLAAVVQPWDYVGGWVRAPKAEIIFNSRLTMQARLLWLWLASIHPSNTNITWSQCEAALCCGTKSRRNCLSQLVEEEFITINSNGVVILHNPYEAYQKRKKETIPSIDLKFDYSEQPNIEIIKTEPKPKKTDIDYMEICKNAWNENKPNNYASVRKITKKQEEAVLAHTKNLQLPKKELSDFIKTVCEGIRKDDFWLNKNSSKTFSTIFGYGKTLDKKLKNVEFLYFLGVNDHEDSGTAYIPQRNQELINSYKEYTFRLEKAMVGGNADEIEKWTNYLQKVDDELKLEGISVEPV